VFVNFRIQLVDLQLRGILHGRSMHHEMHRLEDLANRRALQSPGASNQHNPEVRHFAPIILALGADANLAANGRTKHSHRRHTEKV
jgi:hypothetical protein